MHRGGPQIHCLATSLCHLTHNFLWINGCDQSKSLRPWSWSGWTRRISICIEAIGKKARDQLKIPCIYKISAGFQRPPVANWPFFSKTTSSNNHQLVLKLFTCPIKITIPYYPRKKITASLWWGGTTISDTAWLFTSKKSFFLTTNHNLRHM